MKTPDSGLKVDLGYSPPPASSLYSASSHIYLLWDLRLVTPLLLFPCHTKNIKKFLKKDYKKCWV